MVKSYRIIASGIQKHVWSLYMVLLCFAFLFFFFQAWKTLDSATQFHRGIQKWFSCGKLSMKGSKEAVQDRVEERTLYFWSLILKNLFSTTAPFSLSSIIANSSEDLKRMRKKKKTLKYQRPWEIYSSHLLVPFIWIAECLWKWFGKCTILWWGH